MNSKIKRFDLLADFLKLSREEWLMLMGRMDGTVPRSRIAPEPAITPLTDFGRIRYARTGQRQWIVAPALQLPDQATQHAPPGLKSKDASSPTITEAPDTPGSRLRKARERLGLQQIELGRKLGVSGSYISRIERDLVKIQPMVLRLAEALDVSVDYLLGLSSEQDSDAQALARNYAQADEEQLLIWLAETSPELAEIMRAIKEIPDEEQEYILEALARDLAAIQSEQGLGVKGDADA